MHRRDRPEAAAARVPIVIKGNPQFPFLVRDGILDPVIIQ